VSPGLLPFIAAQQAGRHRGGSCRALRPWAAFAPQAGHGGGVAHAARRLRATSSRQATMARQRWFTTGRCRAIVATIIPTISRRPC